MVMDLYGKTKTSEMVTVICYIKIFIPCTKILGFVACKFTSKFFDSVAVENSSGDVNKIKYGKRYAISSDVSEKHGIVYTSACI